MRKYLDHDVTETLKTQNTSFSFILRGKKATIQVDFIILVEEIWL